jgi:hypothetical protein
MLGASLLRDVGEAALRPASLVSDAFRQRAVLAETDHRPWELPRRPWSMGQTWADLLFAHWPVPEQALRAVVPPQLPIDTREGSAWVGVTPFCIRGLRLRGTAPKAGIYFLSLDADSCAAVSAARRTYRLPYFRSRIRVERDEEAIGTTSCELPTTARRPISPPVTGSTRSTRRGGSSEARSTIRPGRCGAAGPRSRRTRWRCRSGSS